MTEHETHYENLALAIGIDKLRAILETGMYNGIFRKSKPIKAFPAPEKMAEFALADKYLNNWPLAHWDSQHDNVRALLKGTGIKSWSLSDTVSTLKHIAKFHYLETLAESEAKKPIPPKPVIIEDCGHGWTRGVGCLECNPLPTIQQFIEKHGIRFESRRVESRPDRLMSESGGMQHFRCKITRIQNVNRVDAMAVPEIRRSFSLYFSQGSAHTNGPNLADVLDCLASDSSGFDGRTFEDWAADYGYDTDSRKAEKTFRAIKRQAEQMKRTLGAEAYEELLYSVERL